VSLFGRTTSLGLGRSTYSGSTRLEYRRMSAIIWWVTVSFAILLAFKAWQNLLRADRPRSKRRIYVSAFWIVVALCLPICAVLIVPPENRWAWLLVALATNSLLMMGCNCLLARSDTPFWSRHQSSISQLCPPPAHDDDADSNQCNRCASNIPSRQRHPIDLPKPERGNRNVYAPVGGVHPSCSRRVQCQQPSKNTQAQGPGYDQPHRACLSQPKINQITADDLRGGGNHKQGEDANYQQLRSSQGAALVNRPPDEVAIGSGRPVAPL
jgi:hypothetical protein